MAIFMKTVSFATVFFHINHRWQTSCWLVHPFIDKDALDPQDWFTVVIRYGERMILAGQVFEGEKVHEILCCPAFKRNVEKNWK